MLPISVKQSSFGRDGRLGAVAAFDVCALGESSGSPGLSSYAGRRGERPMSVRGARVPVRRGFQAVLSRGCADCHNF